MRAHPASATQPWPSPGTQQRDQSIERLQRQSKSARRTSIRNAGAQSAVFGSPQRLASTNDVARRSWMRRGPDQGAFPPARRMGEHSAEAKSQRWPVSVSRAEPGCALMSPFPKICLSCFSPLTRNPFIDLHRQPRVYRVRREQNHGTARCAAQVSACLSSSSFWLCASWALLPKRGNWKALGRTGLLQLTGLNVLWI